MALALSRRPRWMLLLLLLLLSVAAAAAAAAAPPAAAPTPSSATAYVAFVNDVHNRLEEEEPSTATPCSAASQALGRCVGGWPRVATQVKSLRRRAAEEGAAFFFLDAGDEFTGTLWDVVYKGSVTALVQNAVGVDAMTLGNHEYDAGLPQLAGYIRNLTAPMLGACNVDASEEPALRGLLKKFVVLKHRARERTYSIGVLGWLTPDTAVTSAAANIGKLRFLPVGPAVQQCVRELNAAHPGLDFVIGLSHAGYDSDLATARNVTGLDLIIGGHSHTFLHSPTAAGPIVTRKHGVNASNCVAQGACDRPAGPYPTWVQPAAGGGAAVPVVQAYYSSKYLGLVKIDLARRRLADAGGAQPLLLGGANSSRAVGQDPAILALLERFIGPVRQLEQEVTGRTAVPLVGDPTVSRTNETNLGDYVCSVLLAAVPPAVAARASVRICLMNSGGIRAGIEAPGNITVAAVLAMLPYANANAIFAVTGDVLLKALQHSFGAWPTGGRFMQVAGLRVFHSAGRFLSAVLLGADGATSPIDPKQRYWLTSTDYALQGGDGFAWPGAEVLLPAGQNYAELVMEDLKRTLPGAIAPTVHDRIIDCARAPDFPGCPGPAPQGRRR